MKPSTNHEIDQFDYSQIRAEMLRQPITAGDGIFTGTAESLRQFQCPDWFRDAKFGIWAHWGPQAYTMNGDWYARNMYMQGLGPVTTIMSSISGTRRNSATKICSRSGKLKILIPTG